MIVPQQYKCDVCGIEHTVTNGWYFVERKTAISIYKWDDAKANNILDCGFHFCGAAHALQFVSSEMGEKKEGR